MKEVDHQVVGCCCVRHTKEWGGLYQKLYQSTFLYVLLMCMPCQTLLSACIVISVDHYCMHAYIK